MSSTRRNNLADEYLVLEAQSGSRDAFRQLAERWQARLWRHAYQVTLQETLAADASQDAWLAIARGLGRLHDPRRFGSWALSIVTRRALDAMRKGARTESLRDPDTSVVAAAAEELSESSEVARMRAAMASLPAEQRALLALHHVEGLALETIARD